VLTEGILTLCILRKHLQIEFSVVSINGVCNQNQSNQILRIVNVS